MEEKMKVLSSLREKKVGLQDKRKNNCGDDLFFAKKKT